MPTGARSLPSWPTGTSTGPVGSTSSSFMDTPGETSSSTLRGGCNGTDRPGRSRSATRTCRLLSDLQTCRLAGSPVLSFRLVRGTRLEPPNVPPQPVIQLHGRSGFTPLSQCAFPDNCDPPARFEQIESVPPIALDIRSKLCPPELLASGRDIGVGAIGVSVPEATMHETHGPEASKHEVRGARKLPSVQAESEAASVNSPSKVEFGPRVPASDPGHHARTGRSVYYVRHRRCVWRAEEYICLRISQQNSRLVKTDGYPDCRSGGRRSAVRFGCMVCADDGSRSRRRPRVGGVRLPLVSDPGFHLSFPSVWIGS